jgi:putative ABC transport system ATP-binding protein
MTLLELDRVSRHHRHGAHEWVVLREVSLSLDAGELVAIWGPRRSGRSTLLRIAAGIEPVDGGAVRFAGRALSAGADGPLGHGIGYCRADAREGEAGDVLEGLILAQLAVGVSSANARSQAHEALERTGASCCCALAMHALDSGEAVRVALARALVAKPALLVIDEPVKGVDLLERDAILTLLRSLADEGVAMLLSAGDATALAGADRALALGEGMLRGDCEPELARVVPLRRSAAA